MALAKLSPDTSLALTILGLWLLLALAVGASGVLAPLTPPVAPVIIISLTAFALVLALRISPVREWVATIDPRWLVAVHLTRFVGLYFLVLFDRGELPRGFALYGGWGDIVVATAAALLLLFVSGLSTTRNRRVVGVWNTLGLIDILAVVATAVRSGVHDPASMAALFRLPLSLLPTFVVPLVIATHTLLFLRLRPAQTVRWREA
jgi:hypothetical protein